jgi:uncharacterized protein YbjT (DUF2867 family)
MTLKRASMNKQAQQKTIIILGASGLVGRQLLKQALDDERIGRIIAPSRRPLPAHTKLLNPVVDFECLPSTKEYWQADALLCALGTTMRLAGSQSAFRRVDHDYVLNAAKLAHEADTGCFVLNSSTGSKPDAGSFYLRLKGETECDLAALQFPSLVIVRPSLLDGDGVTRTDQRTGETIAIFMAKLLGFLLPKRLRPVTTAKVAAAMLDAGLSAKCGTHFIESEQLH